MISGFFGRFRFLSNFVPAAIEFEGVLYPSVEHAYQAAKTPNREARKIFADPNLSAGSAKKLGRNLVVRACWDQAKTSVMLALVRQKFSAAPYREQLLATMPHELIEANTWGDTFWGVCQGVGENHLGKILMQVRSELLDEMRQH